MQEHELWIGKKFDAIFGPLLARVLTRLGFHIQPGVRVIPDHVVMSILIAMILIALAIYIRSKLSVDQPGKAQHLFESYVEAIRTFMDSIIGHHDYRLYLPFLATLGLFILFGNLIGLIPSFVSPTSNYNVTVGLAIVTFLYYHWQGIKKQGVLKYLKHFAGPVWWLTPLMLPIEIISHLSRILSLSVRLFANIFGEDMIIMVFGLLFPFILPLPIMFLSVFTSVLQAFVFVLLTITYLAGVLAEEH